ncbi:MAG: cysteine--tRNA ligase [Patescibacteria group bacterium]|nr:cysteine--tRNA ligase [Patescibacteria group bacterium]
MNKRLKLYNTLSRKKKYFKEIKDMEVGLYTCGPTVYNFAHIGNLRTYIFEDILRRVLQYNGYKVNQVMNITDVGHLTSDADEGEDKMEKGAEREKKTVWEIAEYYTKVFFQDLEDLNIETPEETPKATDHITDQIELVQKLEEKDFTYKTSDGIYFDTSKLKDYGKLAKLDIAGLEEGARVEKNKEKKNLTDFALWKFSPKDSQRQMEWDSPWGKGFPGWHLECSAMSTKFLGQPFDIHTGGVDHVPVHHTNEIAQSEAALDKKMANYWLHGEFLLMKEAKMAKSEGDFVTLAVLMEKGYNPLAYRYFCLGAHYRSKLNFSWEALDGAQNALNKLYAAIYEYDDPTDVDTTYKEKFVALINNDLDMPGVLALVWELVKSDLEESKKLATLFDFDRVLGLGLRNAFENAEEEKAEIPDEILTLAEQRQLARDEKNWKAADDLRDEILKQGYLIEDTKKGWELKKKQ